MMYSVLRIQNIRMHENDNKWRELHNKGIWWHYTSTTAAAMIKRPKNDMVIG